MSNRRLTSHAHLPELVAALASAGWGALHGREWHGLHKVLWAFVAHREVNNATGQGFATVPQLAEAAGLGERWTRSRLAMLEDAGVIVWTRGGIDHDGRPRPSWFRVVKDRLVELVMAGRPLQDERDRERWAETRNRVAHLYYLRGLYLAGARRAKKQRSRRSEHAAVSAGPPPLKGDSTPRGAQATAARWWDNTETCEHDNLVGRCSQCAGTYKPTVRG